MKMQIRENPFSMQSKQRLNEIFIYIDKLNKMISFNKYLYNQFNQVINRDMELKNIVSLCLLNNSGFKWFVTKFIIFLDETCLT